MYNVINDWYLCEVCPGKEHELHSSVETRMNTTREMVVDIVPDGPAMRSKSCPD